MCQFKLEKNFIHLINQLINLMKPLFKNRVKALEKLRQTRLGPD